MITYDDGYDETRDGNQTTFRENDFQTCEIGGPFVPNKDLKELKQFQPPLINRGPYRPSGSGSGSGFVFASGSVTYAPYAFFHQR